MTRHYFSWEEEVRDEIRNYIRGAYETIDIKTGGQEEDYLAELLNGLQGDVYNGEYGKITIRRTIFTARGSRSTERITGGDFAIITRIEQGPIIQEKVILVQAKRDHIDGLLKDRKLNEQIEKMKRFTPNPQVMSAPKKQDDKPIIYSGSKIHGGIQPSGFNIEDYFVRRIFTCIDGDTRNDIVDLVSDSDLSKLKIYAKRYPRDDYNFEYHGDVRRIIDRRSRQIKEIKVKDETKK